MFLHACRGMPATFALHRDRAACSLAELRVSHGQPGPVTRPCAADVLTAEDSAAPGNGCSQQPIVSRRRAPWRSAAVNPALVRRSRPRMKGASGSARHPPNEIGHLAPKRQMAVKTNPRHSASRRVVALGDNFVWGPGHVRGFASTA